jgi:probable phosphoglycerate mutase
MQLLLIRHGETEWNVERRIQGWGNSSLTLRGIYQIERLGDRLRETPLTAVYTSDSERTRQTGRAVIGNRDLPMTSLPGLRETSWGEWEGKTAAELSAETPDLWAKFAARGHEDPGLDQADWEDTTLVPGGETVRHASNRINTCVLSIIKDHPGPDDWIVVVGHGGSLRFVITSMLNMRPAAARYFHLDNASITQFSIRDRSVLMRLNDCSHWTPSLSL